MSGQATGFWKLRHAVIGMAVVGILIVVTRSCSGDAEHAVQNATNEPEHPKQGMYVQVPASQSQPAYAQPQPGYVYQQAPVAQPQPGYVYQQQVPVVQPQPGYVYQQQVPVQPQYQAPEPGGNPWANPAPAYQPQQPAQWGQPQAPQVQQWGRTQQPVYSQPQGSSQYRPLDDADQNRQPTQSVTIAVPVPGWSAAPYDRRGGSSFGNNNVGGAWGGGYAGYGYNPAYPVAPYGAGGWPGGYAPGYPGYGVPGRW